MGRLQLRLCRSLLLWAVSLLCFSCFFGVFFCALYSRLAVNCFLILLPAMRANAPFFRPFFLFGFYWRGFATLVFSPLFRCCCSVFFLFLAVVLDYLRLVISCFNHSVFLSALAVCFCALFLFCACTASVFYWCGFATLIFFAPFLLAALQQFLFCGLV